MFAAAERSFGTFVGRLNGSAIDSNAHLAVRFVEHFAARFQYEKGDYASFTREKLLRLRRESGVFSGSKYQQLYERWKTAGAQAVTEVVAPNSSLPTSFNCSFSTFIVDHSYDFFGASERPIFAVR